MINKKLEWKRVGIYLLIAFVPEWTIDILLNIFVGYDTWMNEPRYSLLALGSMFWPAIGNFLTRLITKEGWRESYLHIRVKGHIRYYILAALFPTVLYGIAGVCSSLIQSGTITIQPALDQAGMSVTAFISQMIFATGYAVVISFYTFGEEFGWRGYLYPKLEKLIGIPGAVVAGGIIWGVWHAPLTVCGHNFGTDYWGYPWLGIVLMCLFCMGIGAVLMWLTKRTDSVYPASIAHAVNNNVSVSALFLFGSTGQENAIRQYGFMLAVFLPIGLLCTILMMRDRKKHEATEEE